MITQMRVEQAGMFVAKMKRVRKFGVLAMVVCAGVWMASTAPVAFAQASAAAPAVAASATNAVAGKALAFDVATIKPIPAGGRPTHPGVGVWFRPDGVDAYYQNLLGLMQFAYGYKRYPLASQITGLPGWAASQFYDIEAKMSAGDIAEFQKLDKAGQQEWREAMMRTLLADRFQLKIQRATKPAPIFDLVVAKGGPKMKDAATDPNPPLGKDADGKVPTRAHDLGDTRVMQAYSMEALAELLTNPMTGIGRPVVDKTGLTGTYNFTFGWSVYSRSTHASHGDAEGPVWDSASAIITALGEIGLKLQPSTGALDTIAIEHVEKPSEN